MVLLEQRARDLCDWQVELGQLGGQREHRWRRALVLEPTGVGDEPGVEAQRGVVIERPAEPLGQAPHDNGGGGGVDVDHVECAVALVRQVMIDDDQLARRLRGHGELGEPVERPAVEGHHHVRCAREVGGLGDQVEPREEEVVRRDDEGLRERGDRRLAVGPAQMVHRQHRAERVAIGGDMADQGHGRCVSNTRRGQIERPVDVALRHRAPDRTRRLTAPGEGLSEWLRSSTRSRWPGRG